MGRLVVGDICMGSCPQHGEEGGRNKMKAVAQQQKAVKF